MNIINEEKKDIKNILRRIRKRDFSGNSGIAIKNSSYQLATNIVSKGGSLIFTIILARLLMPELFGLYSVALSTIVLFTAVSELGIGTAMIKFLSQQIEKKGKIKQYINYLGKIKLFLVIISCIALIASSHYLANTFYQKPIFLALIAGSLYIIFMQLVTFLQPILQSSNRDSFSNFKNNFS